MRLRKVSPAGVFCCDFIFPRLKPSLRASNRTQWYRDVRTEAFGRCRTDQQVFSVGRATRLSSMIDKSRETAPRRQISTQLTSARFQATFVAARARSSHSASPRCDFCRNGIHFRSDIVATGSSGGSFHELPSLCLSVRDL